MTNPTFHNLLAMDEHASKLGMGLHPKLRAALEAEIRFSARSSGPAQKLPDGIAPDITPEIAAARASTRKTG
ncbi:MAG: hypothetical protein AAGA70_11405 [Pseudomonadota bacterium]